MQDQDTAAPPGEEILTVDQLTVREQLAISYVQGLLLLLKTGKGDDAMCDRIERLLELDTTPLGTTGAVIELEPNEPESEDRELDPDETLGKIRETVKAAGLGAYIFLDDAVDALKEQRDNSAARAEELARRVGILGTRVLELEEPDHAPTAAAPRTGPLVGAANRQAVLDCIAQATAAGGVTNADIRLTTGLSREVVDRHLRALGDDGEIHKHRNGATAASYTLPGPTQGEATPDTPPTPHPTSAALNGHASSGNDSASEAPSPAAEADSSPPSPEQAEPSSSPKPSSTTPADSPEDTRPSNCPECRAPLVYAGTNPDRECTVACLGGREHGGHIHRWHWNGLGQLRLIVPASPEPANAPAPPPAAVVSRPRNDEAILDTLERRGEFVQGDLATAAGVPKGSIIAVLKRLHGAHEIVRREFAYPNGSRGVAWRLPHQIPSAGDAAPQPEPAAPPSRPSSPPSSPPQPREAPAEDLEDDDGVPPEDEAAVIGVEITRPRAKPPAVSRRVQKLLDNEKHGPPPGVPNLDRNLSAREQQIVAHLRRHGGVVHARNIAVSLVAKLADVGADLRRLMALQLVEKVGDNQFQARPEAIA